MEINDTNVEVLYDFEYSTKDGQKVCIKEGEKLLLLKKTNNDWWQVIRSTGRRPFYVPSTYVRVLESSKEAKDKIVLDVGKKDENQLQTSPLSTPHNFTVSVNIKPGPGEPQKKKKTSSKTKVMLNCEADSEGLSSDKVSERYGDLSTPEYSVQMPKQKNDTLAEANILDDNLSGSLAEMAKEIKFEPVRIRTPERLKYSGSFKTTFERKLLLRSFSGSTPDLTAVDNQVKEERDVSRIKSVEELKSDQENNIVVKGIKPIINIKSMGDIAEKLEKNMSRLLNSNMSYAENNNLKDSTDSVESGRASGETGGASSSDSIELKPKIPVAKPRRSIKPKHEEVIYANCQELMRGESPVQLPDAPPGWTAHVDTETQVTSYVHSATGDKVKKGLFKSLCDNALDSAGRLLFDSRLAAFDYCDFDIKHEVDLLEANNLQITTPDELEVSLNCILCKFENISMQLEALDSPSMSYVMDEEFKKLCSSAEALLDEFESDEFSLENNPATDIRVSVSNLELSTTYSDSTLPLTTSDDDTSSESSDITAWKWDLYMSAYDEYDFLIYNYNANDNEWHSASDALGRVYYFRENSSESSWTLPIHQQQPPSPEPPHPQVSEEMTAIFNKISSIELSARKMRNAKAYSMMIPSKKEENEMTSSLRGWPELSDGRMTQSQRKSDDLLCRTLQKGQTSLDKRHTITSFRELRSDDVVVQPVVCEGPLHYTKIQESGKRARKNWTSVYVVLNELFLLIYKDIKAFHSFKSPPEVTLDLNGAEVSSGEKVSGRKHVLLVSTQEGIGHKVALQCENINSVLHWARNIQQTINNLPKASELVKNAKLNIITEDPSPEEVKKGTNILRSKSVNFKNKDDSMEDLGVNSVERQVKIRARLKKFFHRRPTMESLVKKGIWKDEAVFGSHLDQACSPNTTPRVPPFVQKCISVIESTQENMKTDGLYRASGNLSQIQKIRLQIDQHNYSVLEKEEDVHVLTGALKLFFRELKEPLIPYKLFTKAIKASTTQNKKERIGIFQDIVKALPQANRDTLKFLLQHLLRVTQYHEHNRMHVANVAIVFGPTLMWPEQESANMALDLMQQNMVIEALLIDYQAIFK